MNNSTSCLSNGLAQGIAATLTASAVAASAANSLPGSNGHAGSGSVTSSSNSQVGNGLKEFLLEQHLVRQEPFNRHTYNTLVSASLDLMSRDNAQQPLEPRRLLQRQCCLLKRAVKERQKIFSAKKMRLGIFF